MKIPTITISSFIICIILLYPIKLKADIEDEEINSQAQFALNPAIDSLLEYREIAEEAYCYAFPMLVAYKVLQDFFIDTTNSQFKGPINVFTSEARVFSPADTVAAAVNSDTPYGFAELDLRTEPMVIYLPSIENNRYYNVQLADMYTNNYAYMGSRTSGNEAAYYMIAGPDWKGEKPKGIAGLFHCETQFSLAIFRTQLFGPEDMPNVKRIQSEFKIQPLSDFLGKMAPQAAPEIDWLAWNPEGFTTRFIPYLNFILKFCPTSGSAEVEKAMRERFAKIGIVAGEQWNPKQFSKEQIEAISEGVRLAFKKISGKADAIGININGWEIGSAQGDRDFYNNNWVLRAAAAKNGVYGNDAEEATYPFAKTDKNGLVLDASKHNYTLTFKAGELPPVNAFWSVTMYNARLFLVDNVINRYLINSPMLSKLKKNDDGSLTIFIQHNSPGSDKEANWLPAPDGVFNLVLRLYWPKTDPPSVLPAGEGTWSPPAIVPIANLNAEKAKRFGDISYENVVRTDDRYGNDPIFYGPRGWGYWNYLEYPRPLQNPNLWPDLHSTYFLAKLKLPTGSKLTMKGTFPRARYMKIALYKEENGSFISIGQDLAGFEIEADEGSVNPFKPGERRLDWNRNFTVIFKAQDPPTEKSNREVNTLYTGDDEAVLEVVIRIYLPDQGMDGAGWGYADAPKVFGGLPTFEGELADGSKISNKEIVEKWSLGFESNTKQPISDDQWLSLVNNKDNDPTLDPATSPAREIPKWEKYWNLPYSILGSFKKEEDRAKIPYAGAMDGGGDPATQYMFLWLSRKYGDVYVMRGKMPTFPNTFGGEEGQGLEIMTEAQTQYFSIVSCEAAPSGKIVDGLCDMQIPIDDEGYYTIVVSKKEDRPKNAVLENGIAWLEWSPKGEGLHIASNRLDFGMLMIRIMSNDPNWKESPDNITEPGMEEEIMGPYYPIGEYMDKAMFENGAYKN